MAEHGRLDRPRWEQEAVGWLPARAADPAFEDADLVTEGKYLRPQPEF